jgi:hypothetical protein
MLCGILLCLVAGVESVHQIRILLPLVIGAVLFFGGRELLIHADEVKIKL